MARRVRHFQSSHCLLRGTVVVDLLVFLCSCSSSRSLFITVVAKPLTAVHFSSAVDINFTRVFGSGVNPSVSSSSFLSTMKRWHQKKTCSAFSDTSHRALWCLLMLKPVKVGPKASVTWKHLSQVIVDFPVITVNPVINLRDKTMCPSLPLRCVPFLLLSLEAVLPHD